MFPFFGLTSAYRADVFKQIHEIVFHGGGGYDYWTVYNMPIWLRNYTFRSLQEYFKKKEEQQSNQSSPNKQKTTVQIPKELTYRAKARGK